MKIKPGTVNLVIGKPMAFRKEKEFLDEVRNVVKENMSEHVSYN